MVQPRESTTRTLEAPQKVTLVSDFIEMSFSEIQSLPPGLPGLYEILLLDGTPLKVGIGKNLRRRLMNHRRSPDSGLCLKQGGDRANPDDVVSKCSILGKHLYYGHQLTAGYDLKTQLGRQQFLQEQCKVRVLLTETKPEARDLERQLEASGAYRYMGRVVIRGPLTSTSS